MMKSPTQEKLEAQRKKDIRDIITGVLEKFRGRRNFMMLVAVDLEVTDATVYRLVRRVRNRLQRVPAAGVRRGAGVYGSPGAGAGGDGVVAGDDSIFIAICALVTCAGLLLHSWTLYQVTGELRLLGAELRAMLNAIQQCRCVRRNRLAMIKSPNSRSGNRQNPGSGVRPGVAKRCRRSPSRILLQTQRSR